MCGRTPPPPQGMVLAWLQLWLPPWQQVWLHSWLRVWHANWQPWQQAWHSWVKWQQSEMDCLGSKKSDAQNNAPIKLLTQASERTGQAQYLTFLRNSVKQKVTVSSPPPPPPRLTMHRRLLCKGGGGSRGYRMTRHSYQHTGVLDDDPFLCNRRKPPGKHSIRKTDDGYMGKPAIAHAMIMEAITTWTIEAGCGRR